LRKAFQILRFEDDSALGVEPDLRNLHHVQRYKVAERASLKAHAERYNLSDQCFLRGQGVEQPAWIDAVDLHLAHGTGTVLVVNGLFRAGRYIHVGQQLWQA